MVLHGSMGLIISYLMCMIGGGVASLVLWMPRARPGSVRPTRAPLGVARFASARLAPAEVVGTAGEAGAGVPATGIAGIAGVERLRDLADERERIVRGCMDLADRLRDDRPTLFRKALRDLAAVGVAPVIADGQRVDELQHDIIGAKPTVDPAFHRTIASTERLGFTDQGELVRRPCVIVYEGPEVLR